MKNVSSIWVIFSAIISLLVIAASILGIFVPVTYQQESANWALQAVGQDIGNILAVCVFIIATVFLSKKSIKAFFIWLGSLLYFIYAYTIYAFFVHFNYLFLVYVAVLGLSAYTCMGSIVEQNLKDLVKPYLQKRFIAAGVLLIITGALFELLWFSEIIPALLNGVVPVSVATARLWVNPVQVIDLALVLPGMIVTGILLIRKHLLGYLFAVPWLIFSALMGSSIVATLILELRNGNMNAVPPLVMVGSLVIASIIISYRYLSNE